GRFCLGRQLQDCHLRYGLSAVCPSWLHDTFLMSSRLVLVHEVGRRFTSGPVGGAEERFEIGQSPSAVLLLEPIEALVDGDHHVRGVRSGRGVRIEWLIFGEMRSRPPMVCGD